MTTCGRGWGEHAGTHLPGMMQRAQDASREMRHGVRDQQISGPCSRLWRWKKRTGTMRMTRTSAPAEVLQRSVEGKMKWRPGFERMRSDKRKTFDPKDGDVG